MPRMHSRSQRHRRKIPRICVSIDRQCRLLVKAAIAPLPSPIPVLSLGKQTTGPARTPHGASIAANLSGRARPPDGQATGDDWLHPANQLGSGKIRRCGPSPLGHAEFHYASVCTTSGVMLSKNRAEKVQGAQSRLEQRSLHPFEPYHQLTFKLPTLRRQALHSGLLRIGVRADIAQSAHYCFGMHTYQCDVFATATRPRVI